jgi:hypothetical protein
MNTFEARRPYHPHTSLCRTPVKLSDRRSRRPVSKVCAIDSGLTGYEFLLESPVYGSSSSEAFELDGFDSRGGIHEVQALIDPANVFRVPVAVGGAGQLV